MSSLLSSFLVSLLVSQPHRRTTTTFVLMTVIFVLRLRRLLFHNLLGLVKATVSFFIRDFVSLAASPSSKSLAGRYTTNFLHPSPHSPIVHGSSLDLLLQACISELWSSPHWYQKRVLSYQQNQSHQVLLSVSTWFHSWCSSKFSSYLSRWQ